MSSNFIYYIYAYIRSKDTKTAKAGTPYYIGKGSSFRYKAKHSVPVPKDESYIILLEQNLTEIGALALERRLIRFWGRIDIGTGILRNQTDGGEYVPPMSIIARAKLSKSSKGRLHSEETKAKISSSNKGKKKSEKAKLNMKKSDSAKAKISAAHKGKIVSAESRAKMSVSQKLKAPASLETRRKMGIARSGEKNGMFGRTHSPEAIEKIKLANKNRPPITEETRAKLRAAHQRRKKLKLLTVAV